MCTTAESARSATPASIASSIHAITVRNADGSTSIRFLPTDSQGNIIDEVGSTIDGGIHTFNVVIADEPCITSVDNKGIDVLSARQIKTAPFPSLATLVDKKDRVLDRLNGYTGRGKLTVVKDNINNPVMTSVNFFINNLNIAGSEAFSAQKNNIGYAFYAFDSNPMSISIGGILLDGSDRGSASGLSDIINSFTGRAGKINNTEWLSDFINNYNTFFKASAAIKNGYRVYFGIENFSAEVFCINFAADKSAAPQPLLVPFKMDMIIKRLPTSGSNATAQNTKPTATKETTGAATADNKKTQVSNCEDLDGNYDVIFSKRKGQTPPFVDWSRGCSPSSVIK